MIESPMEPPCPRAGVSISIAIPVFNGGDTVRADSYQLGSRQVQSCRCCNWRWHLQSHLPNCRSYTRQRSFDHTLRSGLHPDGSCLRNLPLPSRNRPTSQGEFPSRRNPLKLNSTHTPFPREWCFRQVHQSQAHWGQVYWWTLRLE